MLRNQSMAHCSKDGGICGFRVGDFLGERKAKHNGALSRFELLEQDFTAIVESNRVAISVRLSSQLSECHFFIQPDVEFTLQSLRYVLQRQPSARRNTDGGRGRPRLGAEQVFYCRPKTGSLLGSLRLRNGLQLLRRGESYRVCPEPMGYQILTFGSQTVGQTL